MIEAVRNNIRRIEDVCKTMKVKSLYLFGSAARGTDFDESSDLDFLFTFIRNENGFSLSGYDYFDLLFKLEEITGKKVDLVAEEKIRNKYFLDRINKEKVPVYES